MSVIRRPAQLSYNIPDKQYSKNTLEPTPQMLLRAKVVQNALEEKWKNTIIDSEANRENYEQVMMMNIPQSEKIEKIKKISQSVNRNTRFTRMKVKTDMFEKHALIGRGGFGLIYLVTDKSDGQFYALKVMQKSKIIENGLVSNIAIEKKIFSTYNFQRSVQIYSTFQDKNSVYYLLEYLPGGDMRRLMQNVGFSEKHVQFIIGEVLLALEEIHQKDIIHLDLKPENVMITNDGHLKLTDFGLAYSPNNDEIMKSMLNEIILKQKNIKYRRCATLGYMAPEVARNINMMNNENSEITTKADLWSLGIMMYELIYGQLPFTPEQLNLNESDMIKYLNFPSSHLVSRNAIFLITSLLQPAKKRPSIAEIKKSKFFKGFNFDEPNINIPPIVPSIHNPFDISHFNSYIPYEFDNSQQFENNEWAKLAFLGLTYRKQPNPLTNSYINNCV